MNQEYTDCGARVQGHQERWPTCIIYATCGALRTILEEEEEVFLPDVDSLVQTVHNHDIGKELDQPTKNAGTIFPHLADSMSTSMKGGKLTFPAKYLGENVDVRFEISYKTFDAAPEYIKYMSDHMASLRQGIVSATSTQQIVSNGCHYMQTWDKLEGDGAIVANSKSCEREQQITVPGDHFDKFNYACAIAVSGLEFQTGPGEPWSTHPNWLIERANSKSPGMPLCGKENEERMPLCGCAMPLLAFWDCCKELLREYRKAAVEVKAVALAPDGGWVILGSKTYMSISPGPKGWKPGSAFWECQQELCEARKAGVEIKTIAFAPDGGWVLLATDNQVFTSLGSKNAKRPSAFCECREELCKYSKAGIEIQTVAFAPDGGWVIVGSGKGISMSPGRHGWKQGSALWECRQELLRAHNAGTEIKTVSFAPDGGWVMLTNNDQVSMGPGPLGWTRRSALWKCREELFQARKAGVEIRAVTFAPDGGWVIIAKSGVWSLSPGSHKKTTVKGGKRAAC